MKAFLFFVLIPFSLIAQTFSPTEIARWEAQRKQINIIRDLYGVPHIYGKTDADAVFGLMYTQCEENFERVEVKYEKFHRYKFYENIDSLWNKTIKLIENDYQIVLKPAALVCYICSSKLFIALREINNPLDKTNNSPHDCSNSTCEQRRQQHNQTLFGITKNKLVNTKTAEENSANTSRYFFRRIWRTRWIHLWIEIRSWKTHITPFRLIE